MRLKHLFALLTASSVLILIGWVVSTMKVQSVEVVGSQSERTIDLKSQVSAQAGDPFWTADLEAIQNQILKHKWVEDAQVRRTWGGRLRVEIVERKPQAILSDGRGGFSFVDGENHIIDKANTSNLAKYPILTGRQLLHGESLRKQALDLIKELPGEGALTRESIHEIEFADDKGFQILVGEGQIRVRLGRENLPVRLERVRRVLQYLKDNRIAATHIDSDYAKKVLVKVNKPR